MLITQVLGIRIMIVCENILIYLALLLNSNFGDQKPIKSIHKPFVDKNQT